MGPAVRRTRPQSRITGAPVHDPNYSGPNVGIAGAVRSNFALKARLPGTEFFDAETGRQKSSRKRANACSDQSLGSKVAGNPRRSALFGVDCGKGGLRRLDGGVRSQIRTPYGQKIKSVRKSGNYPIPA